MLGDLNTPYKHTIQSEAGYQKLRAEYALRTVELRVGNLKTTDFSEATKFARVMDAFGYLDTINHITNHELHDPSLFDSEQFYIDLVLSFEHIYKAVLYGAGKNPKQDALIQDIASLRKQLETLDKSEAVIDRQVYQLIKGRAEGQLDSINAFALSRAVEFHNQTLRADALFKETYDKPKKKVKSFDVPRI